MEEFPRHGAADVSELQKCIVSLIIGSSSRRSSDKWHRQLNDEVENGNLSTGEGCKMMRNRF